MPSHPTRAVARALLTPFWLVTVGFVVVIVARAVAWDDRSSLSMVNSLTVWLFLPAYLVASAAWCFRRYALAALATVAVAFHAFAVVTTIGTAEPIDADARAAPHLRVLSANVKYDNRERATLARELMAADADVVMLQEITSRWVATLGAAGVNERYPYSALYPAGSGGQAIYSRLELHDVRVIIREFWPTISARVEVDGRAVHLVDVHAIGPLHGMDKHRATVDSILSVAESLPEPRIVAGDFNATPYNETMHRFFDLGLDSAHERRGRGLDGTWPNGMQRWPPVRVDDVLVDDGIVVLSIDQLRGRGSDHKPVLADLAIVG
jgi:endonuclease/exonuclease/phosphatase (EEP) superfamily protein YafD